MDNDIANGMVDGCSRYTRAVGAVMSKLIFVAEMFLSPGHDEPVYEIAQAIHDKYMASGTVVYGRYDSLGFNLTTRTEEANASYNTHTGILHDIKEIEKAEPEAETNEVKAIKVLRKIACNHIDPEVWNDCCEARQALVDMGEL